MYVIFYNNLGMMILFLAVLVGYFAGMPAQHFIEDERSVAIVQLGAAVLTILVLDLGYRATHNRLAGWLRFVHHGMGGQMFFIPVWGWVPVIGLAALVGKLCGLKE